MYGFYAVNFFVGHRMLEMTDSGLSTASFESMIGSELDTDISILYEMPMGDSGNTNLLKIPKLPDNEVAIKFPLLEKLAQRKNRIQNKFQAIQNSLESSISSVQSISQISLCDEIARVWVICRK